jgi:hypothetical protein
MTNRRHYARGPVELGCACRESAPHMAAYDALPPPVRRYLAGATAFNYCPLQLRALVRKVGVVRALQLARQRDRELWARLESEYRGA